MKRLPLILIFGAMGCTAVGPDFEAPEVTLPTEHHAALSDIDAMFGRDQDDSLDLATWWRAFEDPVLSELIERAVNRNFDLRQALSRIVEAEAALGVSRALDGPSAGADASYMRTGISENTQFGLFPGQNRESDDYQLSVSASWEIDLWGRAQRSIEAAEADLGARVEGLWSVRVSLAGQIADAYLRLRELQMRSRVAAADIVVLEKSVETIRARVDAGLVQELDLLRASTELETARANLPSLERMQASVATELGLLGSVEPGQLSELLAVPEGAALTIPNPVGRLGSQVPTDLLRRRPDVRAAERQLAAQTARVGIATADLYPSLSLTGVLGLQSYLPENLLKGPSLTHAIGPNVSMPLFSGGGLRANIAIQDARVDQAMLTYESSVLAALHEVDGAATGIALEARRLEALDRAAAEAKRSLSTSRTLYDEGLTNLDAVLDARRALLSIQDAQTQARASVARAHVALYRALGGGWPGDEPE
ncbi:MAG: multidrug efflux system outer membrane protein [Planctomycetota bacterium]